MKDSTDRDLRRIAVIACVLLVTLRLAIGWHLLYEGLWKYNSLSTAKPWSAEGYLKNARGPLRPVFRGMVGDPDDTRWTDYEWVSDHWDDWLTRVKSHYQLNEDEVARLDRMINGDQEGDPRIGVPLKLLPPGMEIDDQSGDFTITVTKLKYDDENDELLEGTATLARIEGFSRTADDSEEMEVLPAIQWEDDANARLTVDRQWLLIPQERDQILAATQRAFEISDQNWEELNKFLPKGFQIDDEGYYTSDEDPDEFVEGIWDEMDQALEAKEQYKEFYAAVNELYNVAAQLPFRERLKGMLLKDPDFLSRPVVTMRDTIQPGDRDIYAARLQAYENKVANARLAFQEDHAQYSWQQTQAIRSNVVDPAKTLTDEMQYEVLTTPGVVGLDKVGSMGPVPEAWDRIRVINVLTITGLIGLGLLLLLGLGTRFAAFAAGGMLLSFYLAAPPWPGVPQPPGPDHTLVFNQHLIEVIALFALTAIPSGRWFGLDALVVAGWKKFRGEDDSVKVPATSPEASAKTGSKPTATASKA